MPTDQDNAQDAARYRKLIAILQKSYDGMPYERPPSETDVPYFTANASMSMGRRDYRLVEATITWSDTRDEPLNLDAALDAIPSDSINFLKE